MFVEKYLSWKGMPQEPPHTIILLNMDTGIKLTFRIAARVGGLDMQKNQNGNVISHNGCVYKVDANDLELTWSRNRQEMINLYEEIKREWTKGQFVKVVSIFSDVFP